MYREHPVARALQPYVECYWTSRGGQAGGARVLPDGCIDILFSLSCRQPHARIVGTMTRALVVPPGPPPDIAAIRFRPGGATPFLRMPAHEATDQQLDLPDGWPASELEHRLADAPNELRRVALLEAELLRRLPAAPPVDRRIAVAVSQLRTGVATVESAAAEVELSRQHLNRLFRREVGIGPKQLERVLRMQRLHRRLRCSPAPHWSSFALDAGYCDQSHMIREYRALTGLTPSMFHFSNTRAAA